jgi:hypothetical protein
MKRLLVVPFVLLILASSGVASTLCAVDGGLDVYIASYNGFNNACQVGDKLFYNFAYSASSTPAGNQPTANQTAVIPDPGDGSTNPGLLFSVGGFLTFPGETMDATITYSIATLSGSNIMENYDLIIAGSNSSSLGFGTVTESFTNAPVGSPLVASVGPGVASVHSAHVNFVPWVSGTTVTTKIHLESPLSGGDLVTISAIQEHFSEAVPEPYETILIGSGLLLFGLRRKRVKCSSN